MAEMIQLEAQPRQEIGSRASRRLRRQGLVPVVLYGHGEETVSLTVSAPEIDHVLREGARMVEIKWDGNDETALIKEIQYDTFETQVLHMDLARVAMDEAITVSVEIEVRGNAPGVKEGGMVDHVMREVEVECLATDIPEKLQVDVSELDIGDSVRLADGGVPNGVTLLGDMEAAVVVVHPPLKEEEEEEAEAEEEAEGPAEPEVITESKREETEEETE